MSGRWCFGWPGRTSGGVTAGSTASWPDSASPWRHRRCGGYSIAPGSNRRPAAFTQQEAASLLARHPYDLRHAAVSTWLNAGVGPARVAAWAGHSVGVLHRVYAKCIAGKEAEDMNRILMATRPNDSPYE